MKKNLITTAISVALASTAFAQNETTQLDPVTVYSAYAAPINQDKTASSVTVLTEKDFSERNATYVSDVLKTVPGVAMGATGGRGAVTSLFLRGANSNHTLVVIDGVKMNPADTNFSFGGLSLSNVERIEVLRGEQSALWGSDAVGGVVYITTKSGLYKEKGFNIDYDLGTGSHGTYDGSVTVSGYQNHFYYALNGNSHRTRGISVTSQDKFSYRAEDGNGIQTGGATERDKFHSDNVSLRLGYDDSSKGIEVLASRSTQSFHNDKVIASKLSDTLYTSAENLATNTLRDRETLFKLSGYLGNEQELLKHKISVSQLKLNGDRFDATAWADKQSSKDWKKYNANYQLDINFDREGEVQQAVSLLADYQRTTYTATAYKGVKKQLSEKSLATEYRLFTEQDHGLSLSGRFIDNSNYKNAWTGRIAGAYRLSPNARIHAGFGSAILNPNLMEYYGYNSKYLGNPALKPEKSLGGDIGVLFETADKQQSLDITYFSRHVKNYIDSREVSCNPVTYECIYQAFNADKKAKIKGVELVYQGKLTQDLSAFANYTYTDIELDKQKDQYGKNYLRRPKHSGNAGLAYQITEKWGSNLNIAYVGKREDMYYGPYPYQVSVKLPSYTLVNVGTNYQLNKHLNVYVNLNNLFNKKYENVLGYGQDGRNIYVGLKGSF
ncbi:TPA: TonB-dependent receptor [Mannheimia haemolytica]